MSKNAFTALTTVFTYDIITFAKMNKHSIVQLKIVSAEHAASTVWEAAGECGGNPQQQPLPYVIVFRKKGYQVGMPAIL